MAYMTNFNDAHDMGKSSGRVPVGVPLLCRIGIVPGDHGPRNAFTTSQTGQSVYIKTEFEVIDGEHTGAKQRVLIGIRGAKVYGQEHKLAGKNIYQNMGEGYIKAILNSSNQLAKKDDSEYAKRLRMFTSEDDYFTKIHSAIVVAKFKGKEEPVIINGIEQRDEEGNIKMRMNIEIDLILSADDDGYNEVMNGMMQRTAQHRPHASAPATRPQTMMTSRQPATAPVTRQPVTGAPAIKLDPRAGADPSLPRGGKDHVPVEELPEDEIPY